MTSRICASIVTFKPDFSNLSRLLDSLSSQVAAVVILSNHEADNAALLELIQQFPTFSIKLLAVSENRGISAHNIAIEHAKKNHFDYILLFDQDSCPYPDMVEQLLSADSQLRTAGKKVAAVGPRSIDQRTHESMPFMRFVGFKKKKCYCNDTTQVCQADFLIMSGMLIQLSVIDSVGLFDTSLFMDNVDMEWCMRANHQGWQCFGVCAAKLQHRLGDKIITFLGKKLNIHAPWRQYYIFYNRVALYKRNYVPFIWKLNDFFHIVFKIIFHSIKTPPRKNYLAEIFRGINKGMLTGSKHFQSRTINYKVLK